MNDRTSQKHLIIAMLLVAVLISISVRLVCFRGYVGLDDSEYAKLAAQFARGTYQVGAYDGPPVFPLRVGIIFPAAVMFNLFGINQWSAAVLPLVLSTLFVLLIFWGTAIFFGPRSGIVAALIWAVFPLDIENATTLLPDLPCAFFSALGFVIAFHKMKNVTSNFAPAFMWGVASGACFGVAWLCKETVLYHIPFALLLLIWTIKNHGRAAFHFWLGVAAGSFLFIAVESFVYLNSTGDLFFRFSEMERNYSTLENGFFSEGSRWGWPVGGSRFEAILKRLFITGPSMIFLGSIFLYMALVAIIAVIHNRYWKNNNDAIPAIWMGLLIVMFNFGTSSLNSYMPLALFNRYLYPVFVPAIIIVAGWLDLTFLQKRAQKGGMQTLAAKEGFFWGAVLFVAIALLASYKLYREYRGKPARIAWRAGITEVYPLISPSDHVYTDPISGMGLKFFWSFPQQTHLTRLENLKNADEANTNSFVLINKRYIQWLNDNAGMWLSDVSGYHVEDFFTTPPLGWRTVWRNDDAVLYKVLSAK